MGLILKGVFMAPFKVPFHLRRRCSQPASSCNPNPEGEPAAPSHPFFFLLQGTPIRVWVPEIEVTNLVEIPLVVRIRLISYLSNETFEGFQVWES